MKISKDRNIGDFSQLYKRNEKTVNSIKFVVDDIMIDVNKMVLDWWASDFDKYIDEDNEIFLREFMGHKEEILDCVELLYGHEVELNFTNVPIILKFASRYQVTELTNATLNWLSNNINKKTIRDTINLASDVSAMGNPCEGLIKVIRHFIEENIRDFCHFISKEKHNFFRKVDFKIMIDILMAKSYLVEICLTMFRVHRRNENHFRYLLDKLEDLLICNNIAIIKNVESINRMSQKVEEELESSTLLKSWMSFTRKMTSSHLAYNVQSPDKLTVSTGKPDLEFQIWRAFKKDQIIELKEKYEINEVEYAMICMDWVNRNYPTEVDDIYSSIILEKLEVSFAIELEHALYTARGIPRTTEKHSFYDHDFERQIWEIPKRTLLDSLRTNKNLKLRSTCDIHSCRRKFGYSYYGEDEIENPQYYRQFRDHLVMLRFVMKADRVHIKVVPEAAQLPFDHTHSNELYETWYLHCNKGDKEEGTYEKAICSFYTHSKEEITNFILFYEDFRIICVCRRC